MLAVRAVLHVLAVFALSASHIWLWSAALTAGSDWRAWLLLAGNFVLLCFFYHTIAFVMHEASHYHLSRWRWLNELLLQLSATLTYGSATLFRQIHLTHHGFTNSPRDLELLPESRPVDDRRKIRRRLLRLILLSGLERGNYHYGLAFAPRWQELRPDVTRRIRREVYAVLALLVGVASAWSWMFGVASWMSGHLLPVLICVWLHGWQQLCEHYGLPHGSSPLSSRDVIPRTWLARSLYWFMFDINYHGLHHAQPFVPAGRMAEAHDQWVDKLRAEGRPAPRSYGSYTQIALGEVLPLLIRQYRRNEWPTPLDA